VTKWSGVWKKYNNELISCQYPQTGNTGQALTILFVKKSLYSDEQRVLQDLLRQLRIQRGLRQEEVAARLETYQTFVSKYEAGERILDLPELRQVCGALGMTLIDFVARYEQALSGTKQ